MPPRLSVRLLLSFDGRSGTTARFDKIESKDLPYQTFRQLRSLRELSIGAIENLITDGICIHSEFNEEPETARGFPVEELYSLYGDQEQLQATCTSCLANVVRHGQPEKESAGWAGCYGWLRSSTDQNNWIESFQRIHVDGPGLNGYPEARRTWYRIWQINSWEGPQLKQLAAIFDLVKCSLETDCPEFSDLQRAIRACLENERMLETELVPSGKSDGIQWTIESHCSKCRCEMEAGEIACGECGCAARPNRARKKKVLGLRPYMLLKDLIGIEATSNLIAKRKNQIKDC